MTGVEFLLKENIDWDGAMVIVAFPSAGSASSIAAHYLRRRLDLPLVGSIRVEGQASIVAVENGISTSPLRIHGGEVECKLGEDRCPSVYLITCDLPLQPDTLALVADGILQETRGAAMVLCLDAVVRDPGDAEPEVYCVSPTEVLRDILVKENVEPLKQAIIVGMSGQVLLGAEKAGLPAAALLVEASETMPDGRAAAALIHSVDELLPSIEIDAAPLLKEALALEQQLAEAQKRAEKAQEPRAASHTFI